jgi:hypothetical protein
VFRERLFRQLLALFNLPLQQKYLLSQVTGFSVKFPQFRIFLRLVVKFTACDEWAFTS